MKNPKAKRLIGLLMMGLILRLAFIFSAYHGDLNNNISWGRLAIEKGLSGFYGSGDADLWPYSAPNQPPLTILLFTGVVRIYQLVEKLVWQLNSAWKIFPSTFIWFWEERGMDLLIKLPSIFADLGIGVLIYQYVLKKKKKARIAEVTLGVWLFNPVIWYNSAVWGQTDAIVNLLGLVAVFALLDKKLVKFAIYLTLSFLFKGSLGIFAPIFLFVAWKQRHSAISWIKAIICSLIVATAASIWFYPRPDFVIWLIDLYRYRILPGEISYLTANAFNFWWLVNPGKLLDSVIFFGLTARAWGMLATLFGYYYVISFLNKKITDKKLFFSLMLTSLISFLFMTRIHERYLYPMFVPATLSLAFFPWMSTPLLVVSLGHFLNLYHLFWAPDYLKLQFLYKVPNLINILAWVNLGTLVFFLRQARRTKI